MGAKIPKEVRLEVTRKWLQGKIRDQIASEVGIGAGTVSSIIKEYRTGDFDADLLREVALNLKNRGLDIQGFAPLVRLREVLVDMGFILGVRPRPENQEDGDYEIDQVSEKKLESLIMALEVFCFKENLSVKQFFECIYSMYLTTEKFGIALEAFPSHIEELKNRIESLLGDISYWRSEKQAALEKCQTTEKLLEEFQMSRPMFDANQRLKQELEQATSDRDKYKLELYHERLWHRKGEEMEWSISEPQLEIANREVGHRTSGYTGKGQRITPDYLKEMVMDLYHRPGNYIDTIMKLRDQYELEHRERRKKD